MGLSRSPPQEGLRIMAKKNINKEVDEMSADDVMRAMGMAPAPDLIGSVADPEPDAPQVQAPAAAAPAPPVSGEATGAPDPWAVMNRMAAAIEALATRQQAGGDSQALIALTAAFDRMTQAQITSSNETREEARRAFRPSNNVTPGVSVFNRRGTKLNDYAKPPLKCLMMLPWLAEWEGLTREEVELLNLLEAGEYTIKRADRSKITITVAVTYKADKVTPDRLVISHESAFSNDNFKMMAPLADMLRDMLKQHDRAISQAAAAVLSDEEEEALIEAGELSVSV